MISFFLVSGLALILVGANGMTDGAAAVAKRFHISDLVIGLTIVAFGTSAPELVISVHPLTFVVFYNVEMIRR